MKAKKKQIIAVNKKKQISKRTGSSPVSEKKYKDLVENALMGIYETNLTGEILFINQAFLQILEYNSLAELYEHNAYDFYPRKEDRNELINKLNSNRMLLNKEINFVTKNGKLISVIGNIFLNEDIITGIVMDNTELKKAQLLINKKNTEFENYFNNSLDLFCIADLDCSFKRLNRNWNIVLGYDTKDMIGKKMLEYTHADDLNVTIKSIEFLIKHGKTEGFINKIRAIDGSYKYIEWKASLFDNKIYASARDITESKIIQKELVMAKESAETSNKLKDAFIANISHEIRTPLNGIVGMTELLQESFSGLIGNKEKEYFQAINQASSRIVKTIDMILNYSRIQAGDLPVNVVNIDLQNTIENILHSYKPIAENKSVNLIFECNCRDTEIATDLYCLTEAILSIVDNSVKFTNEGFVKIYLQRDINDILRLDIQDTGIGISKEYLNCIYEPYSQEEIGYSRSYEGIGLGLSLVKKFLTIIDAKLEVVSEKNKGTTFSIIFANSKNKGYKSDSVKMFNNSKSDFMHRKEKNDSIIKHNNIPKILIIEDDAINQLYTRNILKNEFLTDIAFNAGAALNKLKEDKFDLILMDISLKGDKNGLDLTKMLKNISEYKNIPIIAVTGFTFEEDKNNCFNAGCNDFLAKPFTAVELLKIIEKNLLQHIT